MTASRGWCLIESSPENFTQLVTQLGIKGTQIDELWSLDKDSLKYFGEIYGLIFLFKWREFEGEKRIPMETWPREVYFANQVIENACATQAILSIVLNCPELDIGEDLSYFKEFTRDFTALTKGLSMSNSEILRKVHNSFSSSIYAHEDLHNDADRSISPESATAKRKRTKKTKDEEEKEDSAYHFISYVPVNGRLYELDGLKAGPIDLGPCDLTNWLDSCIPVLQRRMQWFNTEEIGFNCMAVMKDKMPALMTQLAEARTACERIREYLDDVPDVDEILRKAAASDGWRNYSEETKTIASPADVVFVPIPDIRTLLPSIITPITATPTSTSTPTPSSSSPPSPSASSPTPSPEPPDLETLSNLYALLTKQIEEIRSTLDADARRRADFDLAAARRAHDYKPFVTEYLKMLARKRGGKTLAKLMKECVSDRR